jgi:hypothetical protein
MVENIRLDHDSIYNIEVTTTVVGASGVPIQTIVICAPLFVDNIISSLAFGEKIMCRSEYLLTLDDITTLPTIVAASTAKGVTATSSSPLNAGHIVLVSPGSDSGYKL